MTFYSNIQLLVISLSLFKTRSNYLKQKYTIGNPVTLTTDMSVLLLVLPFKIDFPCTRRSRWTYRADGPLDAPGQISAAPLADQVKCWTMEEGIGWTHITNTQRHLVFATD